MNFLDRLEGLDLLEDSDHRLIVVDELTLIVGVGGATAEDCLAVPREKILGACVITRFAAPGRPTLYGVLYENKFEPPKPPVFKFGFVFGHMDESDADIIETARREVPEELGVNPPIDKDNILGALWVKSDDTVMPKCYSVFLVDLSYDASVRPGPDQEGAFKVPKDGPDGIDDLIGNGNVAKNQAAVWEHVFLKKFPNG